MLTRSFSFSVHQQLEKESRLLSIPLVYRLIAGVLCGCLIMVSEKNVLRPTSVSYEENISIALLLRSSHLSPKFYMLDVDVG